MNTSTKLWFATFSALVFTIGLFAGLVLDRTWLLPTSRPEIADGPGRRGLRGGFPGMPGDLASAAVNRLDRELQLSDAQKRDLAALFQAWDARMRQAQNAVQQQFRDERDALRRDVVKILTPEQAARFQALDSDRMLPGPMGRGGRRGR